MDKKYVLTEETKVVDGITLHRIKAAKSFDCINEGELGGWVENGDNLSHHGNCWIYDSAMVYNLAHVHDDACISNIAKVYGHATVRSYSTVTGWSEVYGDALICDKASICGHAKVYDRGFIYGSALLRGDAQVCENARVLGNALVQGTAKIMGNAKVQGSAEVRGNAVIMNNISHISFSPVGSENDTLTAYLNGKDEIEVNRGCFSGTLPEFEQAVLKTHGDNKYAKEYFKLIEFIKLRLKGDGLHD